MSSCPVHSCIIGGRKNSNWWHCFAANCNQGILNGSPNSDKLIAWTLFLLWQKIFFQFVHLDPITWSKQLFGDPVRVPGAGSSAVAEMCRDDRGQNYEDREDPSYPHIVTADLMSKPKHCSSYHGLRKRITYFYLLSFFQPKLSVAAVWMVAPGIGARCL